MSENANAIKFALGTVAVYVAALTVGLRLLYYLAYVLAAVLVAAFIWSQLNKRQLRIRRKVQPSQAQVGQIVQEVVEVENRFWLPKLWLEIRDRSTLPGHRVGAVVSLPARRAKRWRVRTRCVHRGLFHLGPTALLTGDPFGLFRVSRVFNETNELLVYPPTVPLSSFGIPESELPGGTQTRHRAYHTTPNAAGIRDYLPGDPMNRIHWQASARAQKLMVKEFELDPTADIWLVLDLEEEVHASCEGVPDITHSTPTIEARPSAVFQHFGQRVTHSDAEPETFPLKLDPTTEEYAITVTASLAAHLVSQGRSVGFIAWGQHRVMIPADRGGRQLIKILRALAVLRAEGDSPLSELLATESRQFSRQDTLVVVTPSLRDEWIVALQSQLHKGLHASAVIVEPGTFCGSGNALMAVSALSSFDVPTYVIKRDDSIDASLSERFSTASQRNMR
jgi:uncharacterized protein (DUF58 family)